MNIPYKLSDKYTIIEYEEAFSPFSEEKIYRIKIQDANGNFRYAADYYKNLFKQDFKEKLIGLLDNHETK